MITIHEFADEQDATFHLVITNVEYVTYTNVNKHRHPELFAILNDYHAQHLTTYAELIKVTHLRKYPNDQVLIDREHYDDLNDQTMREFEQHTHEIEFYLDKLIESADASDGTLNGRYLIIGVYTERI